MRLIGLVLALSLVLAPFAVEAQQEGSVRRIGFLGPRSPSDTVRFLEAFRQLGPCPVYALTTATMMYREMDMRFWLEQAEAELRDELSKGGRA
jgi:hypothetical protein